MTVSPQPPSPQLLANRPSEERALEIDLLKNIFSYVPSKRPHAIETLAHPFFDELRQPGTTMPPNGSALPELFDFTPEGTLCSGLTWGVPFFFFLPPFLLFLLFRRAPLSSHLDPRTSTPPTELAMSPDILSQIRPQ